MTFLGKFRAFLELPFGVMCFLGELRVGLMLALGGLRAGFMWLYSAWFRLRFFVLAPPGVAEAQGVIYWLTPLPPTPGSRL